MCVFARQITPSASQHARLPLGDWNVTSALNRELTRTTAAASGASRVGVEDPEEGAVASPVLAADAVGSDDGDAAPLGAGLPPVQAVRRHMLMSSGSAKVLRRVWRSSADPCEPVTSMFEEAPCLSPVRLGPDSPIFLRAVRFSGSLMGFLPEEDPPRAEPLRALGRSRLGGRADSPRPRDPVLGRDRRRLRCRQGDSKVGQVRRCCLRRYIA